MQSKCGQIHSYLISSYYTYTFKIICNKMINYPKQKIRGLRTTVGIKKKSKM